MTGDDFKTLNELKGWRRYRRFGSPPFRRRAPTQPAPPFSNEQYFQAWVVVICYFGMIAIIVGAWLAGGLK
jgi:hypothetical protein